jgi:hypothetical protein
MTIAELLGPGKVGALKGTIASAKAHPERPKQIFVKATKTWKKAA